MRRQGRTATRSALEKAKSFVKQSRRTQKKKLSESSQQARSQTKSTTQLRFPNVSDEDRWIIAGIRRSRILQTNLSKRLLEKYLETKELKKELAGAKKERGDLIRQFETEERNLEKKLKDLEKEFSKTAGDFSEGQKIVLELAKKFSELMGSHFRADVEEMYGAFQSLNLDEKTRINQLLREFVEAWEPSRKRRLYELVEMREETGN